MNFQLFGKKHVPDDMNPIDPTNMCSHLQRKLFDAGGEYRALRSASVICYPFVPDHLDANRPALRCR